MNNAVENVAVAQQPEGQAAYSFGQRLQTARRALNLTRQDVARELRLGVDIITALEEEDFDVLGAPIFITGYLKNYTRLLKIPVEPILAAYGQVRVESPRLIADTMPPQAGRYSTFLVRLASLLIVLTLLAGLVSWYQGSDYTLFSTTEKNVEAQIEPAQVTPLPEIKPELDEVPAVVEAEPESVDAPTAVELPAEPIVVEKVIEAVPPQVETTAVVEVEAPADSTQAVDKGDELTLIFNADSWTEVTDSSGQRLVYDLWRAGKQETVYGKSPFTIFIGNASGVEIKYNGELYDFSQHANKNLARFALGGASGANQR